MGSGFLMGLDAGGGGVRCMLVEVDSGILTVASRALKHPVAPGTEGWGYDLDHQGIWNATGGVVRDALSRAGAKADDVLAIAVTSMRHGMVLVDEKGEVLFAVPNRDARAAGQGMEIANERGREFNERTGHWPSPIAVAARLVWLAENAPDVVVKARTLLAINEWLAFRLCGGRAAERSQAAETSLFDIAKGAWATDLAASLKIPTTIFPEVKQAGSRLGGLSAEAAAALGLKDGTHVAVGGGDTQCALLGMGVTEAGCAGIVAGTTVPVQLVVERPLVDTEARLWTGCHVIPKRWVFESNAGAAGEALDWLGAVIFPGDRQAAARLSAEAALSGPGAGGFLSSLGAQLFHASQMGLPVATLSFSHLSASGAGGNLRHLSRSVLDGLAFSVRANLEQVHKAGGGSIGEALALSGGLSRGTLWPQLLAEVTDRPVEVGMTSDASLLGAAICAGAAAGVWPDLAAGAMRLVKLDRRCVPDSSRKTRYQGLYADWQRWRAARVEADSLAAENALRSAGESETPAKSAAPAVAGFRPKILVTTPFDERSLDRLRALGSVEYCTYIERQRVLTGGDLVETLKGVNVLVTEVDIVDAESIERLPDLRVVFSCRSNPVNVDVPACTAFGVPVFNTPGRNAIAVAEMTVAMLLSLCRRIPTADQFMRQPGAEAGDMARMGVAHETYRGSEIHGKTVGIVGFGRIGKTVGALLSPFGVRILVHDPIVPQNEVVRHGAEPVSLDELLAQSDVVTLHAAVTGETRGLIGAKEIARMKKGAIIVNSARAALVDENALADALREGRLGGAALDVWKQEPPASDHPLLGLPDVVATPHIAGNTHEVAAHQGESVADALERLVREERPENILNPPTLAEFRWTGERKKPSAAEIEALGKGTGPAISDLDAEVESSEKAEAKPAVAPPAQGPTTHDSRPATSDSGLQPPASSLQPVEKKGFFGKIGSLFGGGKPAADAPSPAPAVAAAPSSAAAEPPPTAGRLPPATGADAGRIADARRKMEAILRDFVARVDRDPSICEFAKGKNVTVRYVIPDVDLSFSMAFAENVPRSSLGDPAGKPQVTLKMNAEVLDGVFMERIGGMKAAMSGQLAFSGNTMKAMSLQRIQKDLCRLYAEARVAVGDPGDLTGLTTHDATLRSTSPRPTTHDSGLKTQDSGPSGGIAAAPAIIHRIGDGEGTPSQRSHRITVGDERDDLIMAVEELYNAGLLTSTGGNVSVRRAGKPDEAWITPSALPKGALDPRLMVRVNLDGEGLDEDAKAPSSERLMHTRIMKLRPDINAVIHSHGIQAFLLGLAGLPFTPVCTESAFVGEMPRVPFHMPGSDELADAAVKALGKGRAVLLLNHGLLVAATSLRRGVDMTKIIERTAEVLLTCAKLGKQPPVIPADAREMLAGMGDLVG